MTRVFIDLHELKYKLTHTVDGQYIGYTDVNNFPRTITIQELLMFIDDNCKRVTVEVLDENSVS